MTGAGGQVGRCLVRFGSGGGVVGYDSDEWDITDPTAAADLVRPGVTVINCAAYTAVDAAETDEDAARRVNEIGPAILARACAMAGARLIHLSTDYVFAGAAGVDGAAAVPYEPDDPPAPRTAYGRTKWAGERAILASGARATIVRTAGVYTGIGTDFVATMLRLERERETVDVVTDQVTSTTYAPDLAAALLDLAARDVDTPILHLTNPGPVTWFDFAREIFAGVGADPDRVRPTTAARFARPAPRPAYSVLSDRSRAEAGLPPLRPRPEALAAALEAASAARGGVSDAVGADAGTAGRGKPTAGTD